MMRYSFLVFVFLLFSCRSDKRYHDQKEVMPREEVAQSYPETIAALRAEKDDTFKRGEASPLLPAQRSGFKGLDYYDPDTAFVVQARLEIAPFPEVTVFDTTTDRQEAQLAYGTLYFKLKNRDYKLQVYRDPALEKDPQYEDYLFLPFTDLTNGNTTYGGGRYLDLSIPDGAEITLDFNKAYNPYCAYNKKYSCPLVPSENHLDLAVEAGEKRFGF